MQYFQASDDLLLQVAPAKQGTRNVQPFLVCSKRGQERRGIYYIMADNSLIQIGDNAIIAFDILLKLHYCFDVEFASDLVNFYDFITGCIMKLHKPKGCSIALETTLQNVTLKENDERYVITGLYVFICYIIFIFYINKNFTYTNSDDEQVEEYEIQEEETNY